MKMAGAVRTGGKGTVRRCADLLLPDLSSGLATCLYVESGS